VSPPNDALELFYQVVQSLMTPGHDLQHILRRCEFACGISGWQEQSQWFSRELNGYGVEDELPHYRIAPAQLKWLAQDLQMRERVTVNTEQILGRLPLPTDVPSTMEISVGVDRLKNGASIGFADPTGEATTVWSNSLKRDIVFHRLKFCPPANCTRVLEEIENLAFRFVMDAYLQLSAAQPGLDRPPGSEQTITPPIPTTTINISQMYGGQIQQGTIGSTQQASPFAEPGELLNALEQLLESLPSLGLEVEEQQAVEAEVGTLTSQLNNPRRRDAVVRESLGVLRTILTGASGSAAGSGLLELIGRFM